MPACLRFLPLLWIPKIPEFMNRIFLVPTNSDASCTHVQEWLEDYGIKFVDPVSIRDDCLKIAGSPDKAIKRKDLLIDPDPSDPINIKNNKGSLRPVVSVTNNEIIPGGKVNINESVLHHLKHAVNHAPLTKNSRRPTSLSRSPRQGIGSGNEET